MTTLRDLGTAGARRRAGAPVSDERGVAFPMALMVLMMLVSLTLALGSLTASEPLIASNQTLAAQALGLAESGIEHAIWGLSHPTAPGGIPLSMGEVAPSPYDGATFVALSGLGGYTIRVEEGAEPNERNVTAVGWAPTNGASDPRPKGVKKIEVTLIRLPWLDPPCAFCSYGDLDVGGSTEIDARSGWCPGATPQAGTMTAGRTDIVGSTLIWGPGNSIPNEPGADIKTFVAAAGMPRFTTAQLSLLRAMARARGTYYQGRQRFSGGRSLPNGVVFVDTTTGAEFTGDTPLSEAAHVELTSIDDWRGWLIVAGTLRVRNNVRLLGLLYALDDVIYHAPSQSSRLRGALIAENRKTRGAIVAAEAGANADIRYDCQAVRDGDGTVPSTWSVKAGTFRQAEGR